MTFFCSFQLSELPHVTQYYATMRLTELNMYRTQNIPVIAHSCQIKIQRYYIIMENESIVWQKVAVEVNIGFVLFLYN